MPDRVLPPGTGLPVIDWDGVATAAADAADGAPVVITGWMMPADPAETHDYFLLVPEPSCCQGCLPADPGAAIEVFAATPIPWQGGAVRLTGRWRRLPDDDPVGWWYQLREARVSAVSGEIGAGPLAVPFGRRGLLTAGALLGLGVGLAACAAGSKAEEPDSAAVAAARQWLDSTVTVDIHSHAGRILGARRVREHAPFEPVAAPMRAGGMAVICLAMVADSPATHITSDRRIEAFRTPDPGELYRWSGDAFDRLEGLIAAEGLAVISDRAGLHAARSGGPAVIVAAEGADFLEGRIDRLDEAYHRRRLRHLQLTHYRVNELGDIQTAPRVHGGLTDFGAEVVRRCNRLGIVVDIAHGPIELVKGAAAASDKPLVLSHTSLAANPGPRSRRITADHARIVAETGGVIGIWPPESVFPTFAAFVDGFARMADVVGAAHVGLGSDMLGLVGPSVLPGYDRLPDLAAALRATGFNYPEVAGILGGNYARVFAASVA